MNLETTQYHGLKSVNSLDVNSAMINFDGNLDIYLKIISSFKNQYSDTADNIELLLKKGDNVAARKILHTLKGFLASMGAIQLSQQVILLQKNIHSGKRIDDDLIHHFKLIYAQTLSGVDELIAQISLLMTDDGEIKAQLASLQTTSIQKNLRQEYSIQRNSSTQQTVLIVDDSVISLQLAKALLESDYQILTAQSGLKALELVVQEPPDLMLLDIMMPEMDGYAVCKAVKALSLVKDIPIIFLTSKSDHKDETYGFSLGAVDYIAKPINPDVLRSRVKTHLNLKNAYNELNNYKKNLEIKVQQEIKKRQEKEKLLIVQSRFAAMGEMIDAVAHQWKQPLNNISLNSQMLLHDYDSGNIDRLYLQSYQEKFMLQMNHLTTTLDEFRNFFSPNQQVSQFTLSNILATVCLLLKQDLTINKITCQIDKNSFTDTLISGNENEFKHIFINLINNAKDAFNEKNIYPRHISFEFSDKEEGHIVKIKDNAGGIEEGILKTLFLPHVTTKRTSNGTGVGLYMSQQIALKHNAKLTVENIDKGACFTLLIPT